MRKNIYIPEELQSQLDQRPDLNWSQIAQIAFKEKLDQPLHPRRPGRKIKTLSVPPELQSQLKAHPEVNWSHIAQTAFHQHLNKLYTAMNSKPVKQPEPIQITIRQPPKKSKHITVQPPSGPQKKNSYFASSEGVHRVVLITPGWRTVGTTGGQPTQIPDPQIHGLDFDTAARLLANLAEALSNIQKPAQNPTS